MPSNTVHHQLKNTYMVGDITMVDGVLSKHGRTIGQASVLTLPSGQPAVVIHIPPTPSELFPVPPEQGAVDVILANLELLANQSPPSHPPAAGDEALQLPSGQITEHGDHFQHVGPMYHGN